MHEDRDGVFVVRLEERMSSAEGATMTYPSPVSGRIVMTALLLAGCGGDTDSSSVPVSSPMISMAQGSVQCASWRDGGVECRSPISGLRSLDTVALRSLRIVDKTDATSLFDEPAPAWATTATIVVGVTDEGDLRWYASDYYSHASWVRGTRPGRYRGVTVRSLKGVSRGDVCLWREDGSLEAFATDPTACPEGVFAEIGRGLCGVTSEGDWRCGDSKDHHPFLKMPGDLHGLEGTCALRRHDDTPVCWLPGPLQDDAPAVALDVLTSWGSDACGVRSDDGELVCWGASYADGLDIPAGRFIDVSVGDARHCGVREGGQVVCWKPALETPFPAVTASTVAAGEEGICIIEDGTSQMQCTGLGSWALLPTEPVSHIAVPKNHAYWLLADSGAFGATYGVAGPVPYASLASTGRPLPADGAVDFSSRGSLVFESWDGVNGIEAESHRLVGVSGPSYGLHYDVFWGRATTEPLVHVERGPCALTAETRSLECWGRGGFSPPVFVDGPVESFTRSSSQGTCWTAQSTGARCSEATVTELDGRNLDFFAVSTVMDRACGIDEQGRLHCAGGLNETERLWEASLGPATP